MAVLKYKSKDGTIKTLALAAGGVAGVASVNGKTGSVTGVYTSENPPPYPVKSVNGKTGDVIINEIKYARVTTEVFGDGNRHRFLKTALSNLDTTISAQEAILNVINAGSVPMVSSEFEYQGNYVVVSLWLLDGTAVTNSQTMTVLYR